MKKEKKSKLKKFWNIISNFWFICIGIVAGSITMLGFLYGIQYTKPTYKCMKRVKDKKPISRYSGELIFEDNTKEIVSIEEYIRVFQGDELEKTCRSKTWKLIKPIEITED